MPRANHTVFMQERQHFYKFHGAGNDFIIIDNRDKQFTVNEQLIASMCHRQLGIGADGLMLLNASEDYDFEMQYFNADGKEGSMCGNGGRSIVAFAQLVGIITTRCHFLATDGPHQAEILQTDGQQWEVKLQLHDVKDIVRRQENEFFLDTGSPHLVRFVKAIDVIDIRKEGKQLRYDPDISAGGCNVNFVEEDKQGLFAVTYERGVEDITLSCGTGVTAVALAQATRRRLHSGSIPIDTRGGKLHVHFKRTAGIFSDIYLQGPVQWVFEGEWITKAY